MTDFKPFSSPIIALPQKNIDTDLIIPAEFLVTTSRKGLGPHIFANLKKENPDFPEISGRILVAGRNFGCGSSREHAVWAIKDAGIDVIISSDFADIFAENAAKNQLLLITLNPLQVDNILKSGSELTIDLPAQKVIDKYEHEYFFEISAFSKKRMLENFSDLDYLQTFAKKLAAFNQTRKTSEF